MKFPQPDLANLFAPDKIKNRNRIAALFLLRITIDAIVGNVSQPPVRRKRHFMRLDTDIHLGEPFAGIGIIKTDRVIPLVHDDGDLLSGGGGRLLSGGGGRLLSGGGGRLLSGGGGRLLNGGGGRE